MLAFFLSLKWFANMFRHSSAKKKPSQQGFTLIEIMLVLVLIGVMVSLVQFTFQGNKLEQDLKK